MTDPFNLQRFLDAQEPVYPRMLAELQRGQKQSHWMWFIFPQFAGLGHSPMAQRFALSSYDEAVAYLGHSVLGPRLRDCTALVTAVEGRTIHEILGSPDDLKFCSSMTLFDAVSSDPKFATAISKFYGGKPDPKDAGPARYFPTNGSPVSQICPQRVVPPAASMLQMNRSSDTRPHKYERGRTQILNAEA